MASKRFGAMKDFAKAKKPRLDVSIARASSRPSPPRSIIDWDHWDDDDDVILMATQLAEAEIEAEAKRKADGTNAPAGDITFSEFAPLRGTTSTQQMFPPAAPPKQKSSSIDMDAIFGDDEEFDFLAVTLTEDVAPPLPPPPAKAVASQSTKTSITIQQTMTQTTAMTQSRQQEHQIKFLLDRIEALKKDNSKLQKDLGDSNERTEVKSGEVSLLRDELRYVRQQLQASKMEKLALADETSRDCKKKVAEAAKQIAAKDIELKIQNAENTKLRIQQQARTAHDRTLNMSISTLPPAIDPTVQRTLLRLHKLNIHQAVPRLAANNASVYEYNEEQEKGKKQGTLFEVELKQLLLNYAQLQSQPESVDRLVQRIVSSVCKVFTEFASYAQSLEFPHNCMLYPHNPYILHSNHSLSVRVHSLSQPGALYGNERALLLRRYMATLALICRQQGKIARAMLRQRHNDLWLLELAIDAIVKLGFSYEVSEHFGLLEATASLLLSLLQEQQHEEERVEELLVELLKQLVFTRPSPWVFGELSACLLACLQRPQLLARLCVNSPKSCFISDRVRSVYRFGPSSCLLQVYAGLLELCFFSETALQAAYFQLLLSIGSNHVRFAFECFKNPPDFILDMLPYFADDEEADANEPALSNKLSSSSTTAVHGSVSNGSSTLTASDSNSNSNSSSCRTNCECYVKLCLSVVTLVFQMMHQWMLHQRKAGTEQVGEMSRIAVHLLTLVFHEYYLTCLFRDSEETTKHYLSLICNWWSEHAALLGFQPIHLRLLSQLEKSHFMLKPLHQEANRSNPSNDLAEWTRIINHADARTENVAPNALDGSKLLEIDFFGGLKRVDYTFD